MTQAARRGVLCLLLASSSAFVAHGCSGGSGQRPVVTVQVEVFYFDATKKARLPANGARVTFFLEGDTDVHKYSSNGTIGPDGTCMLSTYREGDGAPIGDYIVTIILPEVRIVKGEEQFGKDKLKGRYADRKTSSLKKKVAAGSESPVKIVFDLK